MSDSLVRIFNNTYILGYIPNLAAWEYFQANPMETAASFSLQEIIDHLGFLESDQNRIVDKSCILSYVAHTYTDGVDTYFREHIRKVHALAALNYNTGSIILPDTNLVESVAFLHDTIEDTDLDISVIHKIDHFVALKVVALTDAKGPTRQLRKIGMYDRIKNAGACAVYVKICDRVANYQRCLDEANLRKMKMYIDEHADFHAQFTSNSPFKTTTIVQTLESLYNTMVARYISLTNVTV